MNVYRNDVFMSQVLRIHYVGPHKLIGRSLMRRTATAAVLLLLALQGRSLQAAGDTRPRYSLKQDQPDTGTNIKRDIVSGSVVSLGKAYAELSPEEQAYVKSQYEQMSSNDEPPFPLKGLRPVYKVIAAGQQKFLVTGSMSLAVEVNSQGEAMSVSVLQSPDPEMASFAASVLMLQRYKPALCNGSPCKMQFPFRMSFSKRY